MSCSNVYEQNVKMLEQNIEIIKKNNIHVIFPSSSEVYDDNYIAKETDIINERSGFRWEYRRSKIDLEKLLIESNIKYTILRLFNIVRTKTIKQFCFSKIL